MMRKFSCVQDCSDCCVYRQYYPTVAHGKIGVLLLPDEITGIQVLAREKNVNVRIVPRIATGLESPEKIIAYQMMGKNEDGDLCPFLDVEGSVRAPHGGYRCRIYDGRPLACRAYPLVKTGKAGTLEEHCQFCRKYGTTASVTGLEQEIKALGKIKAEVRADRKSTRVWRYATATGREEDRNKMLPEGWVKES